MQKVGIHDMQFVLADGRQTLLHGINVVCKEKKLGYLYPDLKELFSIFQQKGFNLIRFGIFWDGVEPRPGCFDREYLEKVKNAIHLAESFNQYVILDMHQDLYAQKYADGAPDWATLDDGAYHPEQCASWYDAYLQSDAIIQAADCFWANANAPDGIGLMDHYANMWEILAQTFEDCDNIIGFEPMNEPFMGSLARNAFGEATVLVQKKHPDFDLMNPETTNQEAEELFTSIISDKFLEFDRITLMDFYSRMQAAIRKYSQKPLVTGGNIYCSSDFRTGIKRIEAECENQIYAPHGYDAVVDSDRYESFNKKNVEKLFANKRNSQIEMQLPTLIGEWGAFPSKDFTNDLIRHMNGILEQYLWSSAYWVYYPGMEKDQNYESLCRAYPMITGGNLKSYHYEEVDRQFEMIFIADAGKETVIYCPFVPSHIISDNPVDYHIRNISENSSMIIVMPEKDGRIEIVIK